MDSSRAYRLIRLDDLPADGCIRAWKGVLPGGVRGGGSEQGCFMQCNMEIEERATLSGMA